MSSIRGKAPVGARVELSGPARMGTKADRNSAFEFSDLAVGWYILSASLPGFRETVKAVRVMGDRSVDFDLTAIPTAQQAPAPILTVCEAVDRRDSLSYRPAVVVGIFKSGMDETLRLDCPTELVTGDIGWPGAIGLTKVGNVPDALRGEVERKRQEILRSAPPEAPLRPERVVGLYGVFVSLAGLTSAKCCSAAVETNIPPARLFGIGETDLRVIR
jgi:hypothetical protein